MANLIAESMYAQMDEQGHYSMIIKEIIDHRSDRSAIRADDVYFIDPKTQ
jgi:hypothetical protein